MLSASANFRAALAAGAAVMVKATLTMADGTVHELTGGDFALGGVSVSEATSTMGSFDVGAAVAGTCDLTLANFSGQWDDADFTGSTVAVYAGIDLGGSTEWVLRGTYGIEQPESYGSTIGLTGMDGLRLLQRPYSEVTTGYPASLLVIVTDLCDACGATLLTQGFPNASHVVAARPDDEALSCLDVLGYAAQVAGCFADCDPLGRVRVRWYDTGAFGDGGEHEVVTAVKSLAVATDDVVVTGARVTADDQRLPDGTLGDGGETALDGAEGYVLEVSGNPLVTYGAASTVAAMVGARVTGMRFRPLDLGCIGDPLREAGDALLVRDRRGNEYQAYATSLTWRVGGVQAISCAARTPARNSAAQASAVTRALVQLRERQRAETTAREVAVQGLAQQLADSSGLYTTEEPQLDGSTIYYMHDKPTLAESSVVWKLTATALGMSTDGGQTYPYGLDVGGTAILERVYAIGIDAQYITTGRVGNQGTGGYIDFETRNLVLGSDTPLGDGTLGDALEAAASTATDYLRYQDGELTIGTSDSPISSVLTNLRFAFRTDAGDIAWFGLGDDGVWNMFIETASVRNMLTFGDFAWVRRSNGNMSLKWIG